MDVQWSGRAVDEFGRDAHTGRVIVRVDPRYFRPTKVEVLLGDSTKARKKVGWKPECSFEQLVRYDIAKIAGLKTCQAY